MKHTKEWHLERVAKTQRLVHTFAMQGDSYGKGMARGRLQEAISQAAHAGASLDEIKVARTV